MITIRLAQIQPMCQTESDLLGEEVFRVDRRVIATFARPVAVLQRAGEGVGPRPDHGDRIGPAVTEDHRDQSRSPNPAGRNSHDREATRLGEGAGGADKKCVCDTFKGVHRV